MIVSRMDKAEAEEDKQQNGRNLDQYHDVVGPCGLAYTAHQHDGQQQHDQKRRNIEPSVPTRGIDVLALQVLQAKRQIRRREPLGRQRQSHPVQQRDDVRRKADADAHIAEGVLENEVPADDPSHKFAKRGVGVGIGRPRDRDHRREFRVAESGQCADDRDKNQRDRQRGPSTRASGNCSMMQQQIDDRRVCPGGQRCRIAADGNANNGEDPRPNHSADAQRRQRNRPQRLLQRVLRLLRLQDQLVDRLRCKDLPGQRARSCLQKNWCGAIQLHIAISNAMQSSSSRAVVRYDIFRSRLRSAE